MDGGVSKFAKIRRYPVKKGKVILWISEFCLLQTRSISVSVFPFLLLTRKGPPATEVQRYSELASLVSLWFCFFLIWFEGCIMHIVAIRWTHNEKYLFRNAVDLVKVLMPKWGCSACRVLMGCKLRWSWSWFHKWTLNYKGHVLSIANIQFKQMV